MPRRFEMIDDAMAKVLRDKTEAERLAIAFGMWRFARDFLRATIRSEHPDWDEARVTRAVASRLSHGLV